MFPSENADICTDHAFATYYDRRQENRRGTRSQTSASRAISACKSQHVVKRTHDCKTTMNRTQSKIAGTEQYRVRRSTLGHEDY
jgi:hypothetical protein